VPIAGRLAGLEEADLHLLPGRVRRTTLAAVGEDTVAALSQLRVDVAFVGTNGISVAHGLSTPDHSEAAAKQAMVQAGRRVVVLADSTKVGAEHTVRFAPLSDIDTVVTDAGIADTDRKSFEELGIEVVVA
jgi:DeoR family fructose operon transcriptional repressor